MVRFNDQSSDTQGVVTKVNDSPDKRYGVILTSQGLIQSDQIQSVLWLVNYPKLQAWLKHRSSGPPPELRSLAKILAVPKIDMRGTGVYGSVISNVRWSADSEQVYFLAENARGFRQLCTASVRSGIVKHMTPGDQDVASFDVVKNSILYRASRTPKMTPRSTPGEVRPPTSSVATGLPLDDVLASPDHRDLKSYDLWLIHEGRSELVLELPPSELNSLFLLAHPIAMSPDARYAVIPIASDSIPQSWEEYETPDQFKMLRLSHLDLRPLSLYNRLDPLREYGLVDLRRHTLKKIGALDASYFNFPGTRSVQWSEDGKQVLFTNLFLPLDRTNVNREVRVHPCEAAVFELEGDNFSCLAFGGSVSRDPPGLHLQNVLFNSAGDQVTLGFGLYGQVPKTTTTYRHVSGQWKIIHPSDEQPGNDLYPGPVPVRLFVKEELNDRPTLWAEDSTTKQTTKIWDPNPDFDQLELGQASVYHWADRHGRTWTGGLFLPVGYTKGHRYPLVIQTHGFTLGKFIVDGAYPTAMAARALASAGLMVLQVGGGGDLAHIGTNDEAMDNVEAYETAINALDVAGFIDTGKVGIVGFSRTCWYVENALIAEPGRFAAATIADGVSYGYMQYHLFGPDGVLLRRSYEEVVGVAPIGEGLSTWIRLAPDFHAEKIRTPLRIEAIRQYSVLQEWELYSSLEMQGRPVDLLYFPTGQHILQRPSERLVSEQGNVDWFRFWLQGYEDPDSLKRSQYTRWRKMKDSNQGDNVN